MALVSRARAHFSFFCPLALALTEFLARSRAHEKSSALASALTFERAHF
jgi:hypothetical protein